MQNFRIIHQTPSISWQINKLLQQTIMNRIISRHHDSNASHRLPSSFTLSRSTLALFSIAGFIVQRSEVWMISHPPLHTIIHVFISTNDAQDKVYFNDVKVMRLVLILASISKLNIYYWKDGTIINLGQENIYFIATNILCVCFFAFFPFVDLPEHTNIWLLTVTSCRWIIQEKNI